ARPRLGARAVRRAPMAEHGRRRGRSPSPGCADALSCSSSGRSRAATANARFPFLRNMHGRYRPGLAVIAVHTPEFPCERPARNIERAARARRLSFPIGLDNDYAAWNAYANRYWPSQYVIDGEGHIRYAHVGEGAYGRTERAILALL